MLCPGWEEEQERVLNMPKNIFQINRPPQEGSQAGEREPYMRKAFIKTPDLRIQSNI